MHSILSCSCHVLSGTVLGNASQAIRRAAIELWRESNGCDSPEKSFIIGGKPAPGVIFIATKMVYDSAGSASSVVKNAKRAELVSLVRQLAIYVAGACNGDLAALISSGFAIQKPTRSPVGILPAPENPFLKQGDKSGKLTENTFAVASAVSYMWRIALLSAQNTFLQLHASTKSNLTFEDLTPGQVYQVQVCALGAAGVSEWSPPGQRMVT